MIVGHVRMRKLQIINLILHPTAMSAIVITQALPSERARLLAQDGRQANYTASRPSSSSTLAEDDVKRQAPLKDNMSRVKFVTIW
jgi:hypothetical protein